MKELRRALKPAVWTFYLVIVFEILFMISPFALHFYSAYGPALNFLHRRPEIAWLTQFFLPHFSQTTSSALNFLPRLAGLLILAGLTLFLVAAIPLYWAKFRRRGAVTGGLYTLIRHPQYLGLAVAGLGTALIWPRFLVLLTYVTMLFLYALLAWWEEEQCVVRFGDSYLAYQARTGMFLPGVLSRYSPAVLPPSGGRSVLLGAGICVVVAAAALGLGFVLRDYSLSRLSASYMEDVAVLSPANLTARELSAAYGTAMADAGVQEALRGAAATKRIVYVVPLEWYLPDLPIEAARRFGGHRTPANFDRRYYKLLFTRARTHAPEASGKEIVKAAYGRDPILLVKVDISSGKVTGIDTPPRHVFWGDIPTPMF